MMACSCFDLDMKLKDVWPQLLLDVVVLTWSLVPDRDGAIPGQSHMARGGMAG